jgi:hypothetical protein
MVYIMFFDHKLIGEGSRRKEKASITTRDLETSS